MLCHTTHAHRLCLNWIWREEAKVFFAKAVFIPPFLTNNGYASFNMTRKPTLDEDECTEMMMNQLLTSKAKAPHDFFKFSYDSKH